ncbi:MAG TPA: 2-oxo-4-hydroxy-4-carboxy-5-ureidoimidazoline decarboxylase [Candidatus Solibacter sp.]
MTIAEANELRREVFVAAFGWIFEHSPWVANRAWQRRPFADSEALLRAMVNEVETADREAKLTLLRAHPDLGARASMSDASIDEQSSVGLDRMSVGDYKRLQTLNRAYREKFGFPFLFAVKGSTVADILAALERRLEAPPEDEFQEALAQVYQIASFRLRDVVHD